MVLPERIELSASPLPRECSTPELRQRDLKDGRSISASRLFQVFHGNGRFLHSKAQAQRYIPRAIAAAFRSVPAHGA